MGRITQTSQLIEKMVGVSSLLDVGCRDGILRRNINKEIDYFGADLFNCGPHVNYVGDIMEINFDRKFDIVSAIDILEHLEEPTSAFEKLLELSNRYLIISLPNCYDLKSRYHFAINGTLGGKYNFSSDKIVDRHRWVMSAREVNEFYTSLAVKHNVKVSIYDVCYGSSGNNTPSAIIGRIISKILDRKLTAESIVGVFIKHFYI